MASRLLYIGAPLVIVFGTLFQIFIYPLLTICFGIGRVVQPLSDFPAYKCRRVVHPLLEGCEDLWLDGQDRKLYLACADPESRSAYQPTVNRRNVPGRTGQDRFVVLDIDAPGPKKDFSPAKLTTKGYVGARGTTEIDLHGFDVVAQPNGKTLQFLAVNHRPPVNSTTESYMDAGLVGCNSTVEVFELERGSTELVWKRLFFNPEVIKTPNRVAATGDGGFVATNDHLSRVGKTRPLAPLIGGGSLAYCTATGACNVATGNFLKQPNGLTRSPHDGLYYVPSSADGHVRAFELDKTTRRLRLVATIPVGMPMDNLAVDSNGAIWAAAFPKVLELLKGFDAPRTTKVPAAVYKIERKKTEKTDGKEVFEYEVEKVLEDRDADILPGTTTVLHDAKTGRLFLGGVYSPWIAVCERA